MKFQIGAMTVGDILDRGIRLLLARLGTFYALQFIVLAPVFLLQLAVPEAVTGVPTGNEFSPIGILGGFFGVVLLTLILAPTGSAPTLHVIAQEFIDQRVTLGQALQFALGRFGKLLGTSILCGLFIGLGFILCIVPGFLFYVWYAFAVNGQVVAVENLGGERAMSRSKQLGTGFRGRIFGMFCLVALVGAGASWAVNLPLQILLPSVEWITADGAPAATPFGMPTPAGARPVLNYTNFVIGLVAVHLVNVLVQTFAYICWTLLYFDLRIRKEGFDLELLARQQAPAM